MKYHLSLRRGLLALVLAVFLALALALVLRQTARPTLADDDCDAPVDRWQSREAVRQMAAQQGWQIQRLKIDHGCYEIRGTDTQGRTFKAKIHPETLKVLKMKQEERQRSRERDREHAAPQPDGVATPSQLFTPGTAPRGQTE